jgi:hypothetical protein
LKLGENVVWDPAFRILFFEKPVKIGKISVQKNNRFEFISAQKKRRAQKLGVFSYIFLSSGQVKLRFLKISITIN